MQLLESILKNGHERVCYHHDRETGLRAIIAIHSTVLGNALGGVRRWHYSNEQEALQDVLRLSEGMTYKAACSGLTMGGAKSVILLPKPQSPITEAEARAMGRFIDTFSGAYIGAEDVGVCEQFTDWMHEETDHVMGGTGEGHGGDPSPHTAMGVIYGMQACLQHVGCDQFGGLTVAIQGLGSVGTHLARLLHERGAELGVADHHEDRVSNGVEQYGARAASCDEILSTRCDVFAPCALGAILDENTISTLQARIICGAANNILLDPDVDGCRLKERGILYAPDFIVNAGGLIHLAGLHLGMTTGQLEDMIARIEKTTTTVLSLADSHPSSAHAALAMAKQRIQEGQSKEQINAG